MWRQRNRDKMSMKTDQRELEEKIKNKKDDTDLVKTLMNKMSDMSNDLKKLNRNVEDLKNKDQVVYTIPGGSGTENQKPEQNNKRIFIPSVDTDGMKVSAGQVQKRSRNIDLSDSVDELRQMENEDD